MASLISKPVLAAAIRALPGDAVAGHAPHICIHAGLTDLESAAAPPAEHEFTPTAVALMDFNAPAIPAG
jgi:hypothetical protein